MSALRGPRFLEASEVAALHALYESVYGTLWPERVCLSRYVGETAWPGGVAVMEADGLIVGAQPAYDVPVWVAGDHATATVLVDVATHPAYRRRGIFSRLVDYAVVQAARRGSALVLTTPNKVSYAGFRRKPDWRVLMRLHTWVELLRPEVVLRARAHCPEWLGTLFAAGLRLALHAPRAGARVAGPEPAREWPSETEFDDLWKRTAPAGGVAQRRDATWIRHRFLDVGHGTSYDCLTMRQAGRLIGYMVTRTRQFRGIPALFLVDGLADTAAPRVGLELVESTRAWARSTGAALLVFCGSDRAAAAPWVSGAGFRRVPGLLTGRPYRVCVCAPPGTQASRVLLEPRAWGMTLADSDLV